MATRKNNNNVAINNVSVNNNNKEEKVMINSIIEKAVENFMSYKDNAQKYAGYTPVLVTVNHPITVEDFVALVKKVNSYDIFTAYIDNYKQQKQAELANDKREEEFNSILAKYGIKPVSLCSIADKCGTVHSRLHTSEEAIAEYINELFKEDITMETKTQENAGRNNNTVAKEEKVMTLQEVLMNGTRTERMVQVLEFCKEIKKKQDNRYVDKPTLAQFLYDNEVIGRQLSKNEIKKIGRDELVGILETAVNNLIASGIITPVKHYSVNPLDDMDLNAPIDDEEDGVITVIEKRPYVDIHLCDGSGIVEAAENMTIHVEAEPAKREETAVEKTYRLMHEIGDKAIANKKKGFGTCVSAYIICASILKVQYGIYNMKEAIAKNEITDEMKATVVKVRTWLIKNGYIATAVFKDEKGFRFYTNQYNGTASTSLYDATKYIATGKTEITMFRITKKMNEWYK